MPMQSEIIEGTAKDIMARLAHMPGNEHVRLMIGHPSLSTIARKLQATAVSNGMTAAIHDDFLRSLKSDH